MNKGLKITLCVLGALALGTGGFFTYNYFQKKKDVAGSPNPPAGGGSADKAPAPPAVKPSGGGIKIGNSSLGIIPPASDNFPLKNGSNGPKVGTIQAILRKSPCADKLKAAGLSVPEVDNDFGPITEAALNECYGVKEVNLSLFTTMTTFVI